MRTRPLTGTAVDLCALAPLTRRHRRVGTAISFVAFALSSLSLAGCASAADSAPATQPARDAQSCAVVELFTSEGCSSCPPADRFVEELLQDARKSGRPIYALEFHVDYWNRLGWVDRFSDAEYSRRQSRYVETVGPADVYTPQMFVNGTTGFVGSDRQTAAQKIAASLAKLATARISMTAMPKKEGGFELTYTVTGASPHPTLNVALVQRQVTSSVHAGENGGRELRHNNVVRWFRVGTLDGDGKGRIDVPQLDSVDPKRPAIIAYAQDPQSMAIVGAASIDLP